MRNGLILLLLTSAAVAIPSGATTTAWFGTPGPAPLSDPRAPVMKYDDAFPPLPAQFAHRPGKSDELLDAAPLKADQKKIVGFSLESLGAGDKVWGRRAGTPSFMHTIEWTVNAFKTAGLNDARVIQSGTFYHASGDVLEAVPAEGLERAARFHAFFLEQADQAPESLIAAGKGTSYQAHREGVSVIERLCPRRRSHRLAGWCLYRPGAARRGRHGDGLPCLDTKLNRPVAIKFLSDDLADAAARRRFQREAQTASSLNHPHIVTVHDAGEIEGRQYLVTEFVDGGTLRDWAHAEKRTWRADRRAADRCRRRTGGGARRPAFCTATSSPRTSWSPRAAMRSWPTSVWRNCTKARRRERSDRTLTERTRAGRRHRHHRLHVARAGVGQAARRAQRHLLVRRGAVRDAGRTAAVHRCRQPTSFTRLSTRHTAAAARRRCRCALRVIVRESAGEGPRRTLSVDARHRRRHSAECSAQAGDDAATALKQRALTRRRLAWPEVLGPSSWRSGGALVRSEMAQRTCRARAAIHAAHQLR